ncbi:hypothetical protein [Alicyclobacillus vulcanalis]|uniref:Uncharacterized protein n=1 Tax=Alicyclobacillus vulcanalis TaxID=252246 RepID=A0A1N7MSI4_9BACL|nr:hypothetical protein [Alicyclobacillus vulcanalis]SIS88901.1 hypothetical protein SAMN05421799_10666 [Alicyclobacillus vulcanalis]
MTAVRTPSSLANHPKIKRLAMHLGESVPSVLGRVMLLAWWAADYAKGDDITRYDYDIEDAARWIGSPRDFTSALFKSAILTTDEEGHIYLSGFRYDGENDCFVFDLND